MAVPMPVTLDLRHSNAVKISGETDQEHAAEHQQDRGLTETPTHCACTWLTKSRELACLRFIPVREKHTVQLRETLCCWLMRYWLIRFGRLVVLGRLMT